ncbi:Sphingomyelin phosphodiesterase [Halocaridina rubra]|uniref:Sphingomyelin phosphodiesterase n=1 Tax=Halocaridina rubra TaxID=373956 RepID=A0AAN9A6W4_HALRR
MRACITVVVFLLASNFSWGSVIPNEDEVITSFENLLRDEISETLETGLAGPLLTKTLNKLQLNEVLKMYSDEKEIPVGYEAIFCPLCDIGVEEILHSVRNGTDPADIMDLLIDLCVNLGIANLNFCEHLLHDVDDQLIWIASNRENLTGEDFCGMFLAGLGCETNNPDRIWEIPLPDDNKPAVVDPVIPPDLDFILWTGDLVPHNVWNITREENLMIIKECVQMLADNFPGVPVFPAIGNHESDPVNSFPQPYIDNEFDISWLYDEIANLWLTWLPEDVAHSIAYGGFYTTLIKPGLRVVSMNSNYCYNFNWWLIYDDVDPAAELVWIGNQLNDAEVNGEKVYLIAHIPSGSGDCLKTWSHEFNKIVFRYESTIAGLFYGHTHKDHFMVFYDPVETTRPYHIGYIAGSQTPYSYLNPGYKVYTIDGDYAGSSYRVLDHENWVVDLELANLNDDPQFYHLYSAKGAYNMTDLTPASWDNLLTKMEEPDSPLFDAFYRHYIKAARPHLDDGCGPICKSSILCGLVVSDSSDHSHCDNLQN